MNKTLRSIARAMTGDAVVIAELEAALAESKRNACQAIEKLIEQRNAVTDAASALIEAADAALDSTQPYAKLLLAKQQYQEVRASVLGLNVLAVSEVENG